MKNNLNVKTKEKVVDELDQPYKKMSRWLLAQSIAVMFYHSPMSTDYLRIHKEEIREFLKKIKSI